MKTILKRNILTSSIFVICIFSFIAGFYFKSFIVKDQGKTNSSQEVSANNKDLNTLFTLGDNQIEVSEKKIVVNPGFEGKGAKEVDIEPDNYPKMFEPECERIHVESFTDGVSNDSHLIQISCQKFNRESLRDSYSIIIDADIAQVVDKGLSPSGGSVVYLNNSCTSCAFQLSEFQEYDSTQHKFILANNKHRREFEELLANFMARGEESCVVNGETMTINEALKLAKDDDKCSDLIMGSSTPEPAPQSFITIGQYRKIIENIRRVINGNNVSIFEV